MNTRTRHLSLAVTLLVAMTWAAADVPLGSAFTYQGQIQQNGQPLAGPTADLEFRLFDDPNAGSQIGNLVSLPGHPITEGLFTALLNANGEFGPDAFNGQARWLQISVNGQPLAARQLLTPTPHAMFSSAPWITTSATLSYTGGNVGIGTDAPGEKLSVAGTIESTAGGLKFPDGSLQTSAATPGPWQLNGSTIYYNNGEVGIGVSDPYARLHVGGPGWFQMPAGGGFAVYGQALDDAVGVWGSALSGGKGIYGSCADPSGYGGFFSGRGYFSENVGIGTPDPQSSLHVLNSASLARVRIESTDAGPGGDADIDLRAAGNKRFVVGWDADLNGTGAFRIYNGTLSENALVIADATSNIGIGTTTPVYPLHVESAGERAVYGLATATSGQTHGGYFETASAAGTGVYGRATAVDGVNYGGHFETASVLGAGVYGRAAAADGANYGGYFETASASGAGVYGLASATGTGTYGVGLVGESAASDGIGVYGEGATGVYGYSSDGNGAAVYGQNGFGLAGHFYGNLKIENDSWFGSAIAQARIENTGSFDVDTSAEVSLYASGFLNSATGALRAQTAESGASVTLTSDEAGVPITFELAGQERMRLASNGKIGIAAADPRAPLHILGPVGAPPGSLPSENNGLLLGTNGTTSYKWIQSYGGDLLLNYAGNNVGIGRQPAANRLEVEGEASKTTAGSWLANSDARIKADVRNVSGALETLDRVRLVSFRYTNEFRQQHPSIDDRRYLNVIAQEFADVFPDYVASGGERLPDGSEILQVDSYPLTIYSAAAVQELHELVRMHEARIAMQEHQIEDLTVRLERLESLLGKSCQAAD